MRSPWQGMQKVANASAPRLTCVGGNVSCAYALAGASALIAINKNNISVVSG